MNHSEITVHEAKGCLYLGDLATAAALYRRGLNGALGDRNRVNYRAELAASLAVSGDINGAVTEGMAVLPALNEGGIKSPRTLAVLRPVRRIAERGHNGKDFCAYYDQIGNTSA
jgi:hypothetical protein